MAATKALLLAESRTQAALRKTIDDGIDEASLDATRRERRGGNTRKAAVLAALLLVGRTMASRSARVLAEHRQAARIAAARRLHAELLAAGIVVEMATLLRPHDRAEEDSAHAQAAALSLAAGWQAMAMANASAALREERSLAAAVDDTRRTMAHRVVRTAATETAMAYNSEHAAAIRHATASDEDFSSRLEAAGLVSVWSAVLDRRTCEECAMRDGKVADTEPPLHPLCRCVTVLMSRADAWAMAA